MDKSLYTKSDSYFKDVVALLVFNFVIFFLFIQWEVLEFLYQASREYEHWQLDEIIPLGSSLAFSLSIFAYRRINDVHKISAAYRKLADQNPLANILSRTAGKVLLQSWHQHASYTAEPFSLVRLKITDVKQMQSTYGDCVTEGIFFSIGQRIMQDTLVNSEIVQWHRDCFLILLPNSAQLVLDFASALQISLNRDLAAMDNAFIEIQAVTWKHGMSLKSMLQTLETINLDTVVENNPSVFERKA
ncbi:MAG: GGDEF domain-containing protein [Pseudomonadales bacterium]|nr:GGDEF domain-containing protein [Pseudomonadales bacterium]NRA14026.1 diguanylate cyclase [Oceanospirillaceae bacterium]